MDGDLIIVAGLVMLMLSIPAAVSAFADGRRPWVAMVVILAGAGVFYWGWVNHLVDMTPAEVPHVIIRVLARVIP